jgi:hypothetical protein
MPRMNTKPIAKLRDSLTVKVRSQGTERVLVRPGISLFLYCDERTPAMGPHVAQAVARYLEFIQPAAPRAYLNNSGLHKPFSQRQVTKDFTLLNKMPARYEDFRLRYTESLSGDAGSHEVYYISFLDSRAKDRVIPSKLNLLRMEFPFDILDRVGVDAFIAFVSEIAEALPFQSGNAGYAFQHSMINETDAADAMARLLPRYQGFDPSYELAALEMKHRTPGAHWINLLSTKMVGKLGGVKAVRAALPRCDVRELKNGVLIRGARLPPIGDVDRKSPDIGCLPDVARLLRPLRVELEGFGTVFVDVDAMAWLARFDAMKSKAWKQ